MPPPSPDTERIAVRARRAAGVSLETYAFVSDDTVVGHAVRRRGRDGRDYWHVTDRFAPPFVVERHQDLAATARPTSRTADRAAWSTAGELPTGRADQPTGRTAGHPTWRSADRAARRPSWLLTRPDGAPFARIDLLRRHPLDVNILDGTRHLVRIQPDGTFRDVDDGQPLGRILLDDDPGAGGTELELPAEGDPVLRASLLTLPLCVLPGAGTGRYGRDPDPTPAPSVP
jgi:hypothetical protein